jgi:peptidoglycan/LPS O-acetylase OafA/YrhL
MTNESLNELQSKTIAWLRFPLTILVLFIHTSFPWVLPIDYSHFSTTDMYSILGLLMNYELSHIAVPCFFMFSGFLFFYKVKEWNKNVYRSKLESRFKTLILPYLLWNIVAFLSYVVIDYVKTGDSIWASFTDLYSSRSWRMFWDWTEWRNRFTNILGQEMVHSGPVLMTLWFLRDLILVVFLSPVVYYLAKYAKIYGILFLGVLYYTQIIGPVAGFHTNQLITALFYFGLGSYFSIHGKNLVVSLRKGQVYWFLIALVGLILTTYYYGDDRQKYFYPVFVVSGVFTAINITSFFMERGKLKVYRTLSQASFFVYAIHNIAILHIAARLVRGLYPSDNPIVLWSKYLITPFVCAFLCLGIYLLMRKFVPNILKVLTGNR